ncbi:MAG: hypothetical protein HQK54_10250, partial [Oligoflexales bacterium]|nr:hypothetical protein [Oligoflexales bacterium]
MPGPISQFFKIISVSAFFLSASCDSDNSGSGRDMASGENRKDPIATIVKTSEPASCQYPQKILILDFCSGWWAGEDGGDMYLTIVDILNQSCGNGKTSAEFHHITIKSGYPFYSGKSLAEYNQLWILSGGNSDDEDIPTTNPIFQKFVDEIAASQASLFLGGGVDYIDSVNTISNKIFGWNIISAPDRKVANAGVTIVNPLPPLSTISKLADIPQKNEIAGI